MAPSYNQACLHPFLVRGAAGFCTAPKGALSTLLQGRLPQPPAWLLLESICIRKHGTKQKEKWPQEPRGAGPCSRAAHAHGCRIPGSTSAVPDALPMALLISGSPAGLLAELAEATLGSCTCRVLQAIYSNDLTGSPAVPGPAPSLIGPAAGRAQTW